MVVIGNRDRTEQLDMASKDNPAEISRSPPALLFHARKRFASISSLTWWDLMQSYKELVLICGEKCLASVFSVQRKYIFQLPIFLTGPQS